MRSNEDFRRACTHTMNTIDRNSNNLTVMLNRWSQGDASVEADLLQQIYPLLYRAARRHMSREQAGHTLQTTELVNEVYLKLRAENGLKFDNSLQFRAFSAALIRNILVDHHRRKHRHKRGGYAIHVTLDRVAEGVGGDESERLDWLTLHQQLERLQGMDADCARVVELRYFGGLSVEETAEAMNTSVSTTVRNWRFARSWLHKQMSS